MQNLFDMKKLLYLAAGLMVALAFASCEGAFTGKLDGKWRVNSVTGYEINGSEKSEPHTISLDDKFQYWEFFDDGTFELYYIKEDGDKKTECEGTWTRTGAIVDLKVKGVEDADKLKLEGIIVQLTASKLVFQMTQTYGDYSIIEAYSCTREE